MHLINKIDLVTNYKIVFIQTNSEIDFEEEFGFFFWVNEKLYNISKSPLKMNYRKQELMPHAISWTWYLTIHLENKVKKKMSIRKTHTLTY